MPAYQCFKSIYITSPGGLDKDTISGPNNHHAPAQRPCARRQATCREPYDQLAVSKAPP
ncbi:MAG: hypothetical protein LC790_04520 [Actinobacteria bacterium]|nr:hypothetical protein [Actinomycetota bacterium]